MPSKAHQSILQKEIQMYEKEGFKISEFNPTSFLDFKPDIVLENENKILIIEAVISNDHQFFDLDLTKKLRDYIGKEVDIIKIYGLDKFLKQEHTITVSAKAYKKMMDTKRKTGKSIRFQIDEFNGVAKE